MRLADGLARAERHGGGEPVVGRRDDGGVGHRPEHHPHPHPYPDLLLCSHLAKVGFTLNLLLMVARSSWDSATSPGSGDSAGGEQLPASSRGSDTSDTRAPPRPASTTFGAKIIRTFDV